MTEQTEIAGAPPALPAMLVRLKADARPPVERGTRKFLGTSYVGGNTFREPSDVSVLRILARDLVAAGISEQAGFQDAAQPLVLDVVIKHLGSSFVEGPQNLTMFLPTSPIHAHCELLLELRDRHGRLFLDEVFSAEVSRGGSLLTGLESDAADALAQAIRETLDKALPRVRSSVDAFWARIAARLVSATRGMAARAAAINPLRGRRSNTGR